MASLHQGEPCTSRGTASGDTGYPAANTRDAEADPGALPEWSDPPLWIRESVPLSSCRKGKGVYLRRDDVWVDEKASHEKMGGSVSGAESSNPGWAESQPVEEAERLVKLNQVSRGVIVDHVAVGGWAS